MLTLWLGAADAIWSIETSRLHHAARRRGGGILAAGARAQQPALPVVGLLDSRSPEALTDRLRGFRQGLKDTGYVDGENVTIVYRWAENQFDRLPVLAAELVRQQVAVIATSGSPRRGVRS